MSAMVETVARAMCRYTWNREFAGKNLDAYVEVHWHDHAAGARVAIEAMREPTDALCEAGYSAGTGDWGGKYDNRRELARGRVQPTWQAMIDAALGAPKLTSHKDTTA